MYPENWPKCRCGAPCMDGKDTCGNVACNVVVVDLPRPQTRAGTMTMGAFINACGDACKGTGFTPQTRWNHYIDSVQDRFLDRE